MRSSLPHLLVALLLSSLSTARGQSAAHPAAPSPAATYSAEPLVIEHIDKLYRMNADGTGSWQTTVSVRVQADSAVKQLGVLTLPYAASSQKVDILYARVRHADGSVVETPVDTAIDTLPQVTQAAPVYSDLKQKQLPIRSLGVGDRLEWQAKITLTDPYAPGPFWGQESFLDDGVVLSQTLELRLPQGMYVNVWSPAHKPVETSEGNERVLRWTSSQTRPTVGKDAEAAREAKARLPWTPEQELDADQGKLPDVAWTTFKSWEAVGAWYRGLEGDRMAPDAAIKAKAAQLTAGKSTGEDKVRALYAFVATQIRYIGVDFGIGRLQPHRASEVLENQYGDCKDKHTLLAAMLDAIGLHADAVLIGAGVRFNPAVPAPSAFNHLITMLPLDGQQVWLDATAEVAPYRLLTFPIRDKEALLIPPSGPPSLQRTPASLPFPDTQVMEAKGSLDKEGAETSRITFTFRGDDEVLLRAALRQVSPAQYDLVSQQICQTMGYSGAASHTEVSRIEDTAAPLTLSFDYKRDKPGDWDNFRITPQLSPVSLPRPDDKTPPVRALDLGLPRVESATSEMKLPEGWSAELPEAVHARSGYATYDETYRLDKGTLYADRRVEVLQRKVPVAGIKAYKTWADKVDLGNDKYVQLTGMAGKPANASASTEAGNPEAQRLVAEAYREVQQGSLDDAKIKLDKAKELNGRQIWLWTTYGFIAYQRGNMNQAIEFYQQELHFHPEQYGTYGSLAQAQINTGHRSEAEQTLRSWQTAQPESSTPSIQLIDMLMEDKQPGEAEKVAEAALARTPASAKKDEKLLSGLGQAQLQTGSREKGEATLLALMQHTEDPGMMNDVAYELGNAGLQLPAAEATARAALSKMDEASRSWTLDENLTLLNTRTNLIVATWDTLGWILYREDKFTEAETYLKAAWLFNPDATGGEHLGDLLAKQGNKDEALKAYQLGLATYPIFAPGTVKKTPEQQIRMQERAAALRKAGAHASIKDNDPQNALVALRTVHLGAAKGLDGWAEYRLLLSDGQVAGVEPTGDHALTGGQAAVKAMKLPALWPAGSNAQLVRTGVLRCHAAQCDFVFAP